MNAKPVVYVSDVITEVVKLATEYPNGVYQSTGFRCEYKNGTVLEGPSEQGCIFGQALTRLKVPFDDDQLTVVDLLRQLDIRSNSEVMDIIVKELQWCVNFQRFQDSGESWGSVLRHLGDFSKTAKTKVV